MIDFGNRFKIIFLGATILFLSFVNFVNAERGLNVAVISPSVSTSMEARRVMQREGWSSTDYRHADAILVVVRSMLFNPLSYSYDSIKELEDDAEGQLNISGENFHIYLYSINNDLSVDQAKHMSYKADDF